MIPIAVPSIEPKSTNASLASDPERTISGKLPMKLPLNCTMELSSSMMVTVVVAGEPRVTPVGFSFSSGRLSRTWNDSLPSDTSSRPIGTMIVLDVSPGPKVSEPAVKP